MVEPHALQPLLDALTTRAALVGAKGILLCTNRTWREAAGHPMAGPTLAPGTNYVRALGAAGGPMRVDGLRLATALERTLDGDSEVFSHTFRFGPPTVAQWSRTSLCPIEAEPRCVAVLHEDITEQVHTQAALKRSQARLRTILTGAPIVLFSLDREGVFAIVEGMGGAGTGFVTKDLVGTSVFEAYRHMPRLLEVIRDAMRGRVGVITQTVGHLAFEIRCSPIYRGDQNNGVVGVATDVTERLRAQRMKDDFVSIVSHELRTPLTSIRGSLGLLEGGVAGELSPKARELVRIASSNTDRLVRLINDILDLDKMEAGHVSLHREPIDPRALVDEVVHAMDGYAQQASVTIEVEVQGERCAPIFGDHDRLMQVLTNLLSNAIKFSPEGGRVSVLYGLRSERVRFSVNDDGPGIARADIPKLFQKFHQLDPSDARARGGSGLGLVIAKALVEAHDGCISVDSDVGQGSTFYFEIPLAKDLVSTSSEPHPSRSPAVAIDPAAISTPQERGTEALLDELSVHLRNAAATEDPAALSDARATAMILGSMLRTDGPAERSTLVASITKTLDEAIRHDAWPSSAQWAQFSHTVERLRALLGRRPSS